MKDSKTYYLINEYLHQFISIASDLILNIWMSEKNKKN